MKDTILITGGAGFIGSNLCDAFIQDGFKVICYDNFLTGKKSNVEGLLSNPDFQLVEADILDTATLEKVMENAQYVSHQAALGSVPRSIADPISTSNINTQGFLNVLTAAKNSNVKRFVYASSSSVYGDSKESPKVEDRIGNPLSPYAISKLTNEWYAALFFKLYGLETIGLRYFNVFGNRQDPNGVYAAAIPKFINKFMNGDQIQIYGDGKQTRDFTYIQNVVEANKKAILNTKKEAYGDVFNVACGFSHELNKVVHTIHEILLKNGRTSEEKNIEHLPERQGDVRDSLADISKIQSVLGYEIHTNFEKGIDNYINWLISQK